MKRYLIQNVFIQMLIIITKGERGKIQKELCKWQYASLSDSELDASNYAHLYEGLDF